MSGTDKSQRNTKQRRLIYDTVMEMSNHPDADEIYFKVHKADAKISKATVYRNLKLLAKEGKILRIEVPGADRFDKTAKQHYHIMCTECGRVADTGLEYNSSEDVLVQRETGFKILYHNTIFEGICPECLKKAENGKN